MKFSSVLSVAAAALALLLSVWFFFVTTKNQSLQSDLQRKQQTIQTRTQAVQLQQQQLQAQQEQINAGTTLAQQVGPAVLKDLGTRAIQNKNDNIRTLLSKYGVTISEATPAPAPKPEGAE